MNFMSAYSASSSTFESLSQNSPNMVHQPSVTCFKWDSESKATNAINLQKEAHFTFSFTNISSRGVTILNVRTSCGCTTAQLPALPWLILPGSNGLIGVTVNLTGKMGTIFKTVTIETDRGSNRLSLKINLPINAPFVASTNSQERFPESVNHLPVGPSLMDISRRQNQLIASTQRQAVFRNDCASCHVKPAKGEYGRSLYITACGICHESENRALIVPNLHILKEPTDLEFWKTWIERGKPGSMMPAFAKNEGGPLSSMQIASLATYLAAAIPSHEK